MAVDADVKKSKSDAEIDVKELYYDVYENNLVLLCPISIKPFSECDFIHIRRENFEETMFGTPTNTRRHRKLLMCNRAKQSCLNRLE